ncbi:MAG: FAD-dependent monooxygenase [Chlamydiia bacterium]|nr:FAD-dependent monooxygenase [Chlamydiia bacterium]
MALDEVLIVGAGPVGLVMASELIRHGAKVRIIDKSATYAEDSRAVGIHARTLEVFEDLGVLPEFLKQGVKVTRINLYSKTNRLLRAKYEGFDTPYCFMLDIPQTETELLLLRHLKAQGLEVERKTELNNLELKTDHVEVMIKSGESNLISDQFAYVIGCDGARSTCRHLADIPFPGSEYPSHWCVFDAKIDWSHDQEEAHLFLHEEGLAAFFPLPRDRMRVIFELRLENEGKSPPHATYDLATTLLKQRVEPSIKLHEPQDISPFIIHHRQATHYQKGRLFLAGDAAHIHSPAGGQGMNTGIQDAYNLAWKLALVMKKEGHPNLLRTYHQERHPIAENVLSITDRMTKMMTTKVAAFSFLRDAALSIVGSFDKLTRQLPKKFSQLYNTYAPNALLVEEIASSKPEHVRVGQRAPDHTLLLEGKETRLYELFKGPHFTLLLFSGKKPTPKELEPLSAFSHPHIKSYSVLLDKEPSAHTHYGITEPTAILVRPDGIIGLIQQPPNPKTFNNYLHKVFI